MVAGYDTLPLETLDDRYASLRLMRPELVGQVRRSVERHGVLHPLVVNAMRSGEVVVLDGFKRLQALRELQQEHAPVQVVHLSQPQAQAAIVTYNAPHRGLCELEEAWVVRVLCRQHGMQQVAVAQLLGRHKSWVCRRLRLAEQLDDAVADDMRLGLVSATTARELVRLPRGNQAPVAQAIREHRLTTRQAADLVTQYQSARDDDSRRQLLVDPLRHLDSSPPCRAPDLADGQLSNDGRDVAKQFERFERAARSVSWAIERYVPESVDRQDLTVLGSIADSAARQAKRALLALEALQQSQFPLKPSACDDA